MAKNDLGRGSERAEQPDLYSGYAATKGWTGAPAPGFDADMDSLAEQIGMHSGAVLEIGFGNGDFLNWAKSRGYSVAGFEIQPSLVAQAAAQGHTVFAGPFDPSKVRGERFDFVMMFDVAEHLSVPEMLKTLGEIRQILAPSGRLFIRAPNASSPFGLFHQNSDVTHKTALSIGVVEQYAALAGYCVERVFRARPYPRSVAGRAKRWTAYRLRGLVEIVIGLAYFGGRVDLDPNLHVVLQPIAE